MRRRITERCLWAAVAATAGLAGQAAGQADDPNHGVVFIYPTKDQIYNLMDTVNVTYTSPFPTPNLYTFCDGGGRQVAMQRVPGYNATVPMILNFTSATPCWFNLRPGTLPGFGANTPPFTIIGQERGSGSRVFGPSETPNVTPPPFTTGAGGTRPPTPTDQTLTQGNGGGSTTALSQSTNGANAAANNQSGETGSSSSLSAGASAGIGVGTAIAVVALAGGVFAWWWRKRKNQNNMNGNGNGNGISGNGEVTQHAMEGGAGGGAAGKQYYTGNVPVSASAYTPSTSAYSPAPCYQEMDTAHGPMEIGSSQHQGGYQAAKHEMPA